MEGFPVRVKKTMLLLLLICTAYQFAAAQVHMEIGFNAPIGFTIINDSGEYSDFTNILKEVGILPIPFASVYVGAFGQNAGIGIGIKAHTAIIATIAYPSVMGEINISRFSVQAALGGLYMFHYVLGEGAGFTEIPVFAGDLSLWFGLDKRRIFQLGAGAMAIFPSDFSFSEVPIIGWAGVKASL